MCPFGHNFMRVVVLLLVFAGFSLAAEEIHYQFNDRDYVSSASVVNGGIHFDVLPTTGRTLTNVVLTPANSPRGDLFYQTAEDFGYLTWASIPDDVRSRVFGQDVESEKKARTAAREKQEKAKTDMLEESEKRIQFLLSHVQAKKATLEEIAEMFSLLNTARSPAAYIAIAKSVFGKPDSDYNHSDFYSATWTDVCYNPLTEKAGILKVCLGVRQSMAESLFNPQALGKLRCWLESENKNAIGLP